MRSHQPKQAGITVFGTPISEIKDILGLALQIWPLLGVFGGLFLALSFQEKEGIAILAEPAWAIALPLWISSMVLCAILGGLFFIPLLGHQWYEHLTLTKGRRSSRWKQLSEYGAIYGSAYIFTAVLVFSNEVIYALIWGAVLLCAAPIMLSAGKNHFLVMLTTIALNLIFFVWIVMFATIGIGALNIGDLPAVIGGGIVIGIHMVQHFTYIFEGRWRTYVMGYLALAAFLFVFRTEVIAHSAFRMLRLSSSEPACLELNPKTFERLPREVDDGQRAKACASAESDRITRPVCIVLNLGGFMYIQPALERESQYFCKAPIGGGSYPGSPLAIRSDAVVALHRLLSQ